MKQILLMVGGALVFCSAVFAPATALADDAAGPVYSMQPVRALSADHVGAVGGPRALLPDADRPQSLAAADLDGDGVPELVVGYASGASGFVVLHRGNPQALLSPPRLAGQPGVAPFLSPAMVFDLPVAPRYLAAGDFDADGRADVVAAAAGDRALYMMKGDGGGGLAAPRRVALPGAVSAMASGDVNRRDGLLDLLVGIADGAGPALAVFESPRGALTADPELHVLPSAPSVIAVGRLDDDTSVDVAVGAGSDLWVVHGRDRKLSLDSARRAGVVAAEVGGLTLPAPVAGIAIGDFLTEPDAYAEELAVLDDAGTLHLFERGAAVSEALRWQPRATRAVGGPVEAGAPGPTLLRARISGSGEDLLVFDAAQRRMSRFGALRGAPGAAVELQGSPALDLGARPTAAIAMRLNGDALNDLVLLGPDDVMPWVVESAVLAIYTVTNVSDSGAGSLRQAIHDANVNAGPDLIDFNIPGTGPFSILPLALFEVLTDPVTIDGLTQPGAVANTSVAPGPFNSVLQISLDATNITEIGAGLIVFGGDSVIRGLNVIDFRIDGIDVGSANNFVEGCYVGVSIDGTTRQDNERYGVGLEAAAGNTVGGTAAGSRNIISGNANDGVRIVGAGSTNNLVLGNYLGADVTGLLGIGNFSDGLEIQAAPFNTIGGTAPGAGNLIGDNTDDGLDISDNSSVIQGNWIGIGADGLTVMENGDAGVNITGALHNLGGTAAGAGNVISGNDGGGIYMVGDGTDTLIQGNFIGTDSSGMVAVPNLNRGILIDSDITTIGGAVPGAGNLISGNQGPGVLISLADGNFIQGNFIGTDLTGSMDLGNALDGVNISGATNTTVGSDTDPTAANLISGNDDDGVQVIGTTATGNLVAANFIGVDVSGSPGLPNEVDGVFVFEAPDNTVGGLGVFAPNLVMGNGGNGITVAGPNAINDRVLGNVVTLNGALGIDLVGDGVTPNDATDADVGSNNLQNFPVITSATLTAARTMDIDASLTSTPSTTFRVELYADDACDASGYGEGPIFLLGTNVVTDGSGVGTLSQNFSDLLFVPGAVSGTATDPAGNTSEFSACVVPACPVFTQVLGQTLGLTPNAVTWPVNTYVEWIKGDVSQVGSYLTFDGGTVLPGTSFSIAGDNPVPDQAFFYLVKPFMCGSWQNVFGAEPGRDSNFP